MLDGFGELFTAIFLSFSGPNACQDGLWQKAPKYPEGMGRVKDYFGKIEIDGAPVIMMGLPKCVHQYSFSEAGGETDCSPVKPLVRHTFLIFSFLFFSY